MVPKGRSFFANESLELKRIRRDCGFQRSCPYSLQFVQFVGKSSGRVESVVNQRDMPAADALEELAGLAFGELRVAGLDDDEEAIGREAREPVPVEDGMIPAGELAHDEQRE